MESSDVSADFLAKGLSLHLITREVLEPLTSFALPDPASDSFQAIGNRLREDPTPRSLARLRPGRPGGEDWLQRLDKGLESTHEGLAASHFHYRRVCSIEQQIRDACMSHADAFRELNPDGTFGFGSRPLSFEYAAFTFAVRRTLDYLAICIGSYFKTRSHSIKKVTKAIKSQVPATARKRIQRRLEGKKFERLVGTSSQMSARNELAHYRAIDSGVYNVRWDKESESLQIVLVGGGERLPAFPKESKDLSEMLADQLVFAEDLIFGCFRDMGLLRKT